VTVLDMPPTDTELDVFVERGEDLAGGTSSAVFDSKRREYRYLLTRVWDPTLPLAAFLMLNPSTAGADVDDNTVRRIAGPTGFARAWGKGGVVVVNLFALCSTDPARLRTHRDPVGRYNGVFVRQAVRHADTVVAAWGAGGVLAGRGVEMARSLHASGVALKALGFTSTGQPRHPLYVPGGTALQSYNPPFTSEENQPS
jgi:hypothetical protein